MAKLFTVFFKTQEAKNNSESRLKQVEDWLKNEYSELEIKVISNETSSLFIIGNQKELNLQLDHGILGFSDSNDWRNNELIPDGNFFIYRTKGNFLQLISDATLSRSIYYYGTEDFFVFSSLQIPIIFFKNDFVYDKENTPWFLTSGVQKPFHSLDVNIKMLPPQKVLTLNLNSFDFVLSSYEIAILNKEDNYADFVNVIKKSFNATLPANKKAILLSGGIDSRLQLNLIDNKDDLTAITWTKELNEVPMTDLSIAKKIALKHNLDHKILHLKNADFDVAFELFLKYSEGRIDMISGYLDGFQAWNEIEKIKVSALFRGDEAFSLYNGDNFSLVRHRNGIVGINDFETPIAKYLTEKNHSFSSTKELDNESLNAYAKRLRVNYRLPAILGTLNEIKCFFVEIYNPLLNNSIVAYSKQLNPNIDYREKYFKKINSEFSIMKYATKVSIERVDDYLVKHKKDIATRLKRIDSKMFAAIGLETDAIRQLMVRMSIPNKPKSKLSILKSLLPKKFKKKFLKLKKHNLSDVRLAFRVLLLTETFVKIKTKLDEN